MEVLKHLLEFSVKLIGLLVLPLHPDNTSIEQWIQYEKIWGVYRVKVNRFPTTTTLIYIDEVFFARKNPLMIFQSWMGVDF